MQTHSRLLPNSRQLENHIPVVLRPVIRAYVFGYLSSTLPRVLTIVLIHLNRKKSSSSENKSAEGFLHSFIRVLNGGLELQRFPTFCAALVGGATLLEKPLFKIIERIAVDLSSAFKLRLAKWLSSFIAAWYSLKLLQTKKSESFVEIETVQSANGPIQRPKWFAGRTMDLTIFAMTRAFDIVIGELWSRRRKTRTVTGKWSKIDGAISTLADPAIFATSCAFIMWAWIYSPSRLPRSYNKWIKSAAAVDERLLTALRKTRFGEIQYGVETGQAYVLQDMCRDYNLPLEYGDPAKSIPFPCEIVHMGTGPNCEYHALSRFVRSFCWAFSTYLPINLALSIRNPSTKGLKDAVVSSTRSSTFLGTFIALYYYGICLTRSRIGPRILGTSTSARRQIDSGLCIGGGSALCGWSIMLENAGRRKELSLFVAPRALATLLPRRYLPKDQWKETLAFAMSTAVVFTCVSEKPARVRGVFGKLLGRVLTQ